MSEEQKKEGVDPVQDTAPVLVSEEAKTPSDPASPVAAPEPQTANETKAKPGEMMSLEETLRDMLGRGVHFGHQTKRWNPKMAPYIFTDRNGVHIIDLLQTIDCMNIAKKEITRIIKAGGIVLFICTKRQGQKKVQEIAEKANMPYINSRWIGGLFTNFKIVSDRIKYLNDLRAQRDRGEFEQMIKKEKVRLLKKMERLENMFGGISTMTKLPDLVFVIDPHREVIAIRESHAVDIPVMATLDTNCDPDIVDIPIPANDDAIRSIAYVLEEIGEVAAVARREYETKAGINRKPVSPTGAAVAPQDTAEGEGAPTAIDDKHVSAELEATAEIVTPSDEITPEILPELKVSFYTKVKSKYKTVANLKKATLDQLTAISGIGPVSAEQILKDIAKIK